MQVASTPVQDKSRIAFTHDGRRFLPIDPVTLGACKLEMDLFLRHSAESAPVLYRAAGLEFSMSIAQRLAAAGVEIVFVRADDHAIYRRMVGQRLSSLLADGDVEDKNLAIETRTICAGLVEEVLASPSEPEAVQAVAEVSQHLAQWAVHKQDTFELLMQMSSHDFYTATHMVNVSVGCGLLFRELRPGDQETLPAIIQGGLLHDIGKRDVPAEILTKVGKLSPKEWQIVRRHPRVAYDELRQHPGVPSVVLEMARDHHERLDGKGYPDERNFEQIGFAARICAVVDVFDALTANRQYRKPLTPHQALALMTEGVGAHFDACVLDAWCGLVQRLHERHTPSAPIHRGVPSKLTLEGFLPHCEISGAASAPPTNTRDRRGHTRFRCDAIVRATFITQGRMCAVGVGEPFPTVALDLSQAGIRIRTPWPLSLDDVLEIRMARREGGEVVRQARVMRTEQAGEGMYLSGLRFLAAEEAKKCA